MAAKFARRLAFVSALIPLLLFADACGSQAPTSPSTMPQVTVRQDLPQLVVRVLAINGATRRVLTMPSYRSWYIGADVTFTGMSDFDGMVNDFSAGYQLELTLFETGTGTLKRVDVRKLGLFPTHFTVYSP